jgi:hypothetical protein
MFLVAPTVLKPAPLHDVAAFRLLNATDEVVPIRFPSDIHSQDPSRSCPPAQVPAGGVVGQAVAARLIERRSAETNGDIE